MASEQKADTADQYAVVGNPIAQSLSPQIHRMFAEQTAQTMDYTAMLAELDGFAETLQSFFASGGQGLNVTVPFKQQAWQLVDECSAVASQARAVNTIKRQPNGKLYGTNTDGAGLCRDLNSNLAWPLQDARILLLGAGGAARGVIQPLLASSPASLTISNRTKSKAAELVTEFADIGPIEAVANDALQSCAFDLVINATSASLGKGMPDIPSSAVKAARVYDMVYATEATPFMRWAIDNGATDAADGLGMLVEQAAEAFAVWRGVRPQTEKVLSQLRQS